MLAEYLTSFCKFLTAAQELNFKSRITPAAVHEPLKKYENYVSQFFSNDAEIKTLIVTDHQSRVAFIVSSLRNPPPPRQVKIAQKSICTRPVFKRCVHIGMQIEIDR
jgi:hypothetical protein